MIDFLVKNFGESVTDEIIASFKSELGKKFVAKADYNTKRDELNDAREKLAALEESEGNAEKLKGELESLQARYDEEVTSLNTKLEQMKLEGNLSSLIRKSGGKNEKAVRALLNLSDENPMESAAQQLEELKKSEPYLFDVPSPAGAKGNFPRSTSANTGTLTYSQMMKMNNDF